jgi:membrane-bound metal-dependent hydrolase YbcI (DUF457 family)
MTDFGSGILLGMIIMLTYCVILDYFTTWKKFHRLHKEKVLETKRGTYTFTPKGDKEVRSNK